MDQYNVAQPRTNPDKQRESELLKLLFIEKANLMDVLAGKCTEPYLPWKKFEVRYRQNQFGLSGELRGISAEEAWYALALWRRFKSQKIGIRDTRGEEFTWIKLPNHEKQLHEFDMKIGGNLISDKHTDAANKRERFLRQSLIEEAIASSQLEGAATTRQKAKKMLAENKRPTSHDEWMIYNNYQTIRKIEQETMNYSLSREVLLDLHVSMTKHAIEEDKMGRWRLDSDEIVVKRNIGNEEFIAHIPPDQSTLQKELDRLIAFANDEEPNANMSYVHPVIKAVMIHFWFAYLHPFCDGNGRLSRSLFYWYLFKKGYWLIGYLPISMVIKKSPAQYADAYLFSEQYNNDLTYFLDYNLRKLAQAQTMFDEHVDRVKEKTRVIDRLIPEKDLNERQKHTLHHLLGKSEDEITAARHADFHEVGWLTASKDLKSLEAKGYIKRERRGREVIYKASSKLRDLVHEDEEI